MVLVENCHSTSIKLSKDVTLKPGDSCSLELFTHDKPKMRTIERLCSRDMLKLIEKKDPPKRKLRKKKVKVDVEQSSSS
jgi:hypothetical protein